MRSLLHAREATRASDAQPDAACGRTDGRTDGREEAQEGRSGRNFEVGVFGSGSREGTHLVMPDQI